MGWSTAIEWLGLRKYCANSKSNSTSNFLFTIKHHSRRSRSPLAPTSIAGSRRIPCPRAQGCFLSRHEQASPFPPEEYTSENQQLSQKTQAQLALKASFSLQLASRACLHSITQSLTRSLTQTPEQSLAHSDPFRHARNLPIPTALFPIRIRFRRKSACGAKT